MWGTDTLRQGVAVCRWAINITFHACLLSVITFAWRRVNGEHQQLRLLPAQLTSALYPGSIDTMELEDGKVVPCEHMLIVAGASASASAKRNCLTGVQGRLGRAIGSELQQYYQPQPTGRKMHCVES